MLSIYTYKCTASIRKVFLNYSFIVNVVGYKLHIEKSIVFVRTSSEEVLNKIKKTIPFKVGLKNITNLRINLTKDVQVLCTEDNKILVRQIKEDLNKWKVLPCS